MLRQNTDESVGKGRENAARLTTIGCARGFEWISSTAKRRWMIEAQEKKK
jgi:hypothetical protein